MCYLHGSPLGSHGHLKSSNCLVDSRWIVKISGTGLSDFRTNPESEFAVHRDLLWTAPELLRMDERERPKYGTQKGDVYSFAIILQEIAFRAMPFFGTLPPKGRDMLCYDCVPMDFFAPCIPGVCDSCPNQRLKLKNHCIYCSPKVKLICDNYKLRDIF